MANTEWRIEQAPDGRYAIMLAYVCIANVQNEQIAERIVNCVNSHDGLVALLREACDATSHLSSAVCRDMRHKIRTKLAAIEQPEISDPGV